MAERRAVQADVSGDADAIRAALVLAWERQRGANGDGAEDGRV